MPQATKMAAILDPALPQTETTSRQLEMAAPAMGLKLQILKASNSDELNAAFAAVARERPDALFVASGALFDTRRVQLVHLASRHAIPASYSGREYVEIGGLMSYGPKLAESFHLIGSYTGRILKGEKPNDLPVVLPTKFELVINAQTAKLIGLDVPAHLLARADEVIDWISSASFRSCSECRLFVQVLLQKSFCTGDQKFAATLFGPPSIALAQ